MINSKKNCYINVDIYTKFTINGYTGLSDSFVWILLNKNGKKLLSDCTWVILEKLNHIFKHTSHFPIYLLRDDKINIKILDYDKLKTYPIFELF